MKLPGGTGRGNVRPTNIMANDDMMWVAYFDKLVGLKGAK